MMRSESFLYFADETDYSVEEYHKEFTEVICKNSN